MRRPGTRLPRLCGVAWRGRTLSGAEFALHVGRIAGGLHSLGIGPGSTVALVLRNSFDMLAADRASRWLGANSVPVNWHASQDDINYVIGDSRADIALVHPGFVTPGATPAVREVIVPYGDGDGDSPAGPVPAGTVSWADLLSREFRGPLAGSAVSDSTIYTSGTTGKPKASAGRPRPARSARTWPGCGPASTASIPARGSLSPHPCTTQRPCSSPRWRVTSVNW